LTAVLIARTVLLWGGKLRWLSYPSRFLFLPARLIPQSPPLPSQSLCDELIFYHLCAGGPAPFVYRRPVLWPRRSLASALLDGRWSTSVG